MISQSHPSDYDIISSAERIVVMDFEGSGNKSATPEEIAKAPKGWKPPGQIIEIGAVELLREGGELVRGRNYHTLVNPEGPVNPVAVKIHGIHPAKLKNAPRFSEIMGEFLTFLGDAPLVAHAYKNEKDYLAYDMARAKAIAWGEDAIALERWFCTQYAYGQAFPAAPKNLDAVCDRLWIDRTERFDKHGALLDADLTVDALLRLIEIREGRFDPETMRQHAFHPSNS